MKQKPELRIVVSNTPSQPATPVAPPQQAEMPFAVVNGEPISQLPRDLYIPPQALEVFLEAFEGPLDLLLYLIRRQNLDVLDIPIAEITRQYMRYIELVRRLQEYERFKRAASDVDQLVRLDRDVFQASAELRERPVARVLPQVT